MKVHRTNGTSRRGSVMVMSLIAITGLAILSAGFFQVVMGSRRSLTGSVDDRRAYMLAEAALSESFTALRAGASGNVGTQAAPAALGEGLFWVEARDLGRNHTQLLATAMASSGRASIGAVVTTVPGAKPLFARALTSQGDLDLATEVVCDSFDSADEDDPTWAGQAVNDHDGVAFAGDEGGVRSQGDVILGVDAHVHGNAAHGVGSGVTSNLGSYLSGSEVIITEPFPFTAPQTPALVSSGPLTVGNGAVVEKGPGDYEFDSIDIQNGGSLKIEGPANVVLGDFTGDLGALLEVDASGGPVTFFVEGSYNHDAGFQVETSAGSPGELSFQFSSANDVIVPDGATLRGGYYVPNAAVVMGNDTQVFGAITSRDIVTGERMRVHYDEVLVEQFYTQGDGSTDSEVQAWFEATVEPRWLRLNRKDPFHLLNVDPEQALLPSEAWL